MSLAIMPATQKDYPGFVDVFIEVEELHRIQAPWMFKKPEPELFAKSNYDEIISNPDTKLLLAKDGSLVIGYVLAFKKESSPIPIMQQRDFIEVDTLVVKNGHKRQGIGDMLMKKIEDWAREKRINDLQLTVWKFNENAIKFYEKNGYEVISHKMRKTLK